MAIFKLQRLFGVHTKRVQLAELDHYEGTPPELDKVSKLTKRTLNYKNNTPERILNILHKDPTSSEKLRYDDYFKYKMNKITNSSAKEKANQLIELMKSKRLKK